MAAEKETLPWVGKLLANCKHIRSSFPIDGPLHIRRMEPNYVRLNPEMAEQERNPVALLWWVLFPVRAKQDLQIAALPELQTHITWVRAGPHCCASHSASKDP